MDQDYTRVGDHVTVLKRHWWVVALCSLLGGVAGLLLVPLESTSSTATAVVLVPPDIDPTDPVDVGTQSALVTSDRVVQAVIGDLSLSLTPHDLEQAVSVEVVPDTTTLSIAVTLDDRGLVAGVANAFAETYMATEGDFLRRRRQVSQGELEQQLRDVNEELLAARRATAGLKGKRLIGAQQQVTRVTQRQRAINSALSDAEAAADEVALDEGTDLPLRRAVTPESGSGGRLRSLLLGVPVGFVIGLLLAYRRFYRDDTVRDDTTLSNLLGATPVLGRVPVDPGRGKRVLAGRSGGDPLAAEAYRALAGNVRFRTLKTTRAAAGDSAPPEARGAVVAVTSCEPGAGKTTVACNLALSAAATGLKVLLVDADLHRPQVAEVFEIDGTAGLGEVLRAPLGSTELPLTDVGDGLFVLPAGTPHQDPFAALLAPRADEVWPALAAEHDLVIVDTSPLLFASESVSVAARCDHVLLVAEPGGSTATDLAASLERLRIAGSSVSGLVLNRVRAKDLAGGYYAADGAARA